MKRLAPILAFIILLLLPVTAAAAPPASPRDWSVKAPDGDLLPNAITAPSAILIDARTGTVLFEKDADTQRAPASLTKIMTCLLALENSELTDQVTVCDLKELPRDASVAGLKKGEVLSMEDVLYALMLRSGGDAALAIAVHIAGSSEAFSEMMNQKATDIGMTNTHFTNPHGLTEGDHYSTSRDLALLTMECMKYPKFRKIVGTYEYTCFPTNLTSEPREWKNTNTLINPSNSETYAYEYAIGVKTGYTRAAGYCLASAAAKDDMELIAIVLHDGNTDKFISSITIFEYGFEFYDTLDVQAFLTAQPLSVSVANAASDDPQQGVLALQMVPDGPCWITRRRAQIAELRDDPDRFHKIVELIPNLIAPVRKGDEVGTVRFSLDGNTLLNCTLMASRDVEAQPEPTPEPSAVPTAQPVTPAPTTLPSPYLNLAWLKYVLVAVAALVGVPVLILLLTRVKRERQHKHYRYRTRRR